MATRGQIIWTCDRCGGTKATAQGDRSIGWATLREERSERAAIFPAEGFDICLLCVDDLILWLRSGKKGDH